MRCMEMNLNRKIEIGKPIRKEKLLLNGKNEERDVYRVSIKELYYNVRNGRVSTFVSGYNYDNELSIDLLPREEFNIKMMQFIKESGDEEYYKQTRDSIRDIGQTMTAIVLENGCVIDGNRRFTCLRDLYQETANEKYMYLECFVLPVPITESEKRTIKSLELMATYGAFKPEEYSAIDKLVDIYIYLVNEDTKLFTPEEYRTFTNNLMTISKIKLQMVKAEILYEYLKFIGKENRVDYARDMKLDGPLQEIALKKNNLSDDEWARLAPVIYTELKRITNKKSKDGRDKTREIRKFLKLYNTNPNEFKEISDDLFRLSMEEEKANALDKNSESYNTKIREIVEMSQNITDKINELDYKVNKNEVREKSHKVLEDIIKKLFDLDFTAIRLSSKEEKRIIGNDVSKIEENIKKIKEVIEYVE